MVTRGLVACNETGMGKCSLAGHRFWGGREIGGLTRVAGDESTRSARTSRIQVTTASDGDMAVPTTAMFNREVVILRESDEG